MIANGRNVSAAREFTSHLADLLRRERAAMLDFLLALSEFDARRLWVELGYASLFDFLHRELKLSRSSAYYRNAAVALVQRYPAIADALADGNLCLTSLAEIGKVISPENAAEILPRFYKLSSREAKEVAAAIAPHPAPPRREVVTTVAAAVSAKSARTSPPPAADVIARRQFVQALGQDETDRQASTPLNLDSQVCGRQEIDVPPADEVRPLTSDLRRLHITVSRQWMEKLSAVKRALSHSHPRGSAEEVIEAAFDVLLEREARRKALVKRPRSTPPSRDLVRKAPHNRSRAAIPAHVRRAVMLRDQGCCQARLHDGTICGSKVRLQFDHAVPDALGGPATIDNVQLRCERHIQLAARRFFGDGWMDLFTHGAPLPDQ